MERLPELQDAVGPALQMLGDGNWKMGEGVQVGKGPKTNDLDERTIMEHYLFDVVSSVINTLLTLSRTNKRPSFGSIFLLNNISYFRAHIIIEPKTDIPSLLSKPARDLLESNFRTAKAAYFDSNFSPLMQTLTEEKGVRVVLRRRSLLSSLICWRKWQRDIGWRECCRMIEMGGIRCVTRL
ncbi:hypothetical protein QCA50_011878 [Cerrena zonata]|uniref:Exocyst complex subunit Exo70 C-terminal domain-containing protein n=1 Tax=Cerrena zonata TaxID=2478898 RepID=A0AAW0FXX2_9APHY